MLSRRKTRPSGVTLGSASGFCWSSQARAATGSAASKAVSRSSASGYIVLIFQQVKGCP